MNFLRTSALLFFAGGAAAQDEVGIFLDKPTESFLPGSVQFIGHVTGTPPFEATFNGTPLSIQSLLDERTQVTTHMFVHSEFLDPGNYRVELEVTDGEGRSTTARHDLLLLPGWHLMRRNVDRPVHRVANTEELLAALGPERFVVLLEGDFVLEGEVVVPLEEGVAAAGGSLRLTDLEKLDLIGSANGTSRIVGTAERAPAIQLARCSEMRFLGVEIVRDPGEGRPAEGFVLEARSSSGLKFEASVLRGATAGLELVNSSGIEFVRSAIEECQGGILSASNCVGVGFEDSRFVANGLGRPTDIGVELLGRVREATFVRVQVLDNRLDPSTALFDVESPGVRLYFRKGKISGNTAQGLLTERSIGLLRFANSQLQKFDG